MIHDGGRVKQEVTLPSALGSLPVQARLGPTPAACPKEHTEVMC